MEQYKALCQHILDNGEFKEDRTGTGTYSVFGYQARYDLSKGFPLLGLKQTSFRLIAEELFWFLSGDTNAATLAKKNVGIWNPDAYRNFVERYPDTELSLEGYVELLKTHEDFADEYGNLGPIYGKQWRNWSDGSYSIDQIEWVIEEIKRNPNSRRLIVNAWNVIDLEDMALPPCHMMFQFYVSGKEGERKLNCQLYQRSADVFLGVPFNIASYALLTYMIAHVTGLGVGEFVHTIGDAHLYANHIEQTYEMIKREDTPLPLLHIKRDVKDINDFTIEDFELVGYEPHPPIKGKVSVGL